MRKLRRIRTKRILDPRAHVSPRQRVSKRPKLRSQTCAEEKSSGVENRTKRSGGLDRAV